MPTDPNWFYICREPTLSPSEYSKLLFKSKRMTFASAVGIGAFFRLVGWPTLVRTMGMDFSWDEKDLKETSWELSSLSRLFFGPLTKISTDPSFGMAFDLNLMRYMRRRSPAHIAAGLAHVGQVARATPFIPEARLAFDVDGEFCPQPVHRTIRGRVHKAEGPSGPTFSVEPRMRSWYQSKPYSNISTGMGDDRSLAGVLKHFVGSFGPRQLRESRQATFNWRMGRRDVKKAVDMRWDLQGIASR